MEATETVGKKLRIGTRGSRLALAQTALVEEALRSAWPGLETETVILHTKGDQVQDKPLSQVGQKGVFVSEFETALLDGRIDLAVHSAKDLPVRLAEGLDILAVLPRADARDVLVLPRADARDVPALPRADARDVPALPGRGVETGGDAALRAFAAFSEGAGIGTGSLRRQLYGKRLCPQADFTLIRGNVDSRLKKLESGGYDGIILAKAGLDRLGIPEREGERFHFLPIPESAFLPAACQGIIAVEGRSADGKAAEGGMTEEGTAAGCPVTRLAAAIDDPLTRLAFETERRALLNFGADCSAPAAAYCRVLIPDGADDQEQKSGGPRLELSVMYAGRELSGTAPAAERLSLADSLCAKVRKASAQGTPEAGKVWLVGAGCGGPELITVKGLSLVERCDVLLYDSLSAKELLERARPDCERIDVGKRYGGRAASQEEINGLLIQKAGEGKTVVRLKGGDPYVFGRGGEEMLALREAGIACEEVPGISSAFAAPAAAGIPVTHRGLSRSVTVLTASSLTEGEERLTEADYEALVRLSGTLVILMGMHHIKELTDRLIGAGMPPSRPAAVVMEGATDRQRWVRAPLDKLAEEARRAGLKAPAVIVIGETAAMELTPMDFRPLSGVRVGVTGTEGFAAGLCAALQEQGAETVGLNFLETVSAKQPLPELSGFSWLVFTSPNGVRIFLEKMKRERRDLRTLTGKRIAVIGPGTGEALAENGLICDLMPEIHDGGHLGAALAETMGPDERALLLRSELAGPALTRALDAAERKYRDFPLYELREIPGQREKAFRRLREAPPDYLLFGSASGVRSFAEGLIRSSARTILPDATECIALPRVGCIGPQCRAAWEEEKGRLKPLLTDLPQAFTAETFNIDGLVRAVEADWKGDYIAEISQTEKR